MTREQEIALRQVVRVENRQLFWSSVGFLLACGFFVLGVYASPWFALSGAIVLGGSVSSFVMAFRRKSNAQARLRAYREGGEA